MSLGHVGPGGVSVNSERAASAKREIAEIERQIEERRLAPLKQATEAAAKVHGQLLKEELELQRLELRHNLTTVPGYCNFRTEPYTGDVSQIQPLVQKAFDEFRSRTSDDDVETVRKVAMINCLDADGKNRIDLTKSSNWEALYQHICKLYDDLAEMLKPAPEPVAQAPVVEDQTAADLQRQIDALPIGNSRERERLERLLHQHQIKKELLLDNKTFRDVMLTICDDSGLQIPAKVNLQFIDFLKSPAAREYQQGLKSSDLDEYAMSLRLAFSQFTATDSWLTVSEKQEQAKRRNIASYSAENIKQIVGSTNTFGYDPGRLRQ